MNAQKWQIATDNLRYVMKDVDVYAIPFYQNDQMRPRGGCVCKKKQVGINEEVGEVVVVGRFSSVSLIHQQLHWLHPFPRFGFYRSSNLTVKNDVFYHMHVALQNKLAFMLLSYVQTSSVRNSLRWITVAADKSCSSSVSVHYLHVRFALT